MKCREGDDIFFVKMLGITRSCNTVNLNSIAKFVVSIFYPKCSKKLHLAIFCLNFFLVNQKTSRLKTVNKDKRKKKFAALYEKF